MSDKTIDYKELLIKYIKHLHGVEGSDFTNKLNDPASEVEFFYEETKALLNASREARYG